MLKITQKIFNDTKTNKNIAYAEVLIINDKYDYKVTFDQNTKKRANVWLRSLGFRIGEVVPGETVPEKTVTI